jgi:hypothetical protein
MFLLGLVLDVVWTVCVAAVAERRALLSGVSQAIFTVLATAAAWLVIERKEVSLLLAYALGCGVGTYAIVKWKTKRRPL